MDNNLIHSFNSDDDYKDWLKTRKRGLGGSDVSALIGYNQYRTPLDVYYDKVNDVTIEQNSLMKTGLLLEPLISKIFIAETGKRIKKPFPAIIEHSEYNHLKASLDFEVLEPDDTKSVLELKSTRDITPESINIYRIQCNWYCYITGYAKYYITILQLPYSFNYDFFVNNFNDFTEKELRLLLSMCKYEVIEGVPDDDLIDLLVNTANDFWNNHILTRTPPEPQNIKDIQKLYPKSLENSYLDIGDSVYEAFLELSDLDIKQKLLEKQVSELKESFILMLKDKESLKYNGKDIMTYKTSKDSFKLDTDKLKTDYSEIYSNCLKLVSGSRTFRIINKR